MNWRSRIPGFGFRTIKNILSSTNSTLSRFNQTIHGSSEAAKQTTGHRKSGISGIITAKGVKDYVVAYQYNDYVCLTISTGDTVADVSNHICGNVPVLKPFTPINTYISLGCKYFVHLCRIGNITFSCKDLVE